MAFPGHDELPRAIQRYAEVADAVKRREMDRFINEIKRKWDPEPESESTEPHYDGYTDFAAMNLHIYQLAFEDMDPPRDEPLCEAEKYDQILLQPPDESLVDCIPKPLADPARPDQITAKLESMKAALREQVEITGTVDTAQLEVPEDFHTLMSLTNGLQAAGVPAETQQTILTYPLAQQRVEREMSDDIAGWVRRRCKLALAAWNIGGSFQHRSIYYVFCYSSSDGNIVNNIDLEVDFYKGLAHFLRNETDRVERTPGGAIIEDMVLRHDRYPIW